MPRIVRRVATAALILIGLPGLFDSQRISASAQTSVDLSTYVRVGRFDLPEPTRTIAPAGSLLAQEASGVTYNWDTDTLFIVGDGGTSVVQVSKTGALIDSMSLATGSSPQGTEFYDTEGIAYVGGGMFVLPEERYRQANLFTYVAGGTLQRSDVLTVKLGTTVGNVGLEGLSYDPMTGGFIFVKEKDPQSIFQTGIDFAAGTATNGSPTSTSSINLFSPALANLADFSDVFALSNLPFLSGQSDSSHLLILSQESGQIVNVDRSGNVSSTLTITDAGGSLSVPDMTMEGIAMDRDGNLYIVNENGGGDPSHPQLWVYAHSDAPNLAPTGATLNNAVASIPENTSTAAPVKVADIVVIDDGLGQNQLSVIGTDAGFFQITGTGLFLKAGTILNSITKPGYSVTINVDDVTVGSTPDASVNFELAVTASTGGTPALIISEVAPWSSGNSPASLRVDWIEVTNIGTATQMISGWKMDDSSNSFGSGVFLNGVASIAPGESVIFMETSDATLAAKKAAFLAVWFGTNPPASLKVGNYSGAGVGLSTDGDAVNVYDSTGVVQANVAFLTSTPSPGPFRTFDNGAGANNVTITTLSADGINGAFIAASDPLEVGSPGTIGAPTTPVVTIAATDADAAEAGSDTGNVRITRTGGTVGLLTVNYTITTGPGQATDADYTPALTGVASIASGQSFVDITIAPVDDALFEGPESLTLTLFDSGSYDIDEPSAATVSIDDNDPPDTTIDSWPSDPSNSAVAHFTFSGNDGGAGLLSFECSIDSASFAACSSPVTYNGLADGSHTFSVRSVDQHGGADATPASFTWLVDTTAPTITVPPDQTVNQNIAAGAVVNYPAPVVVETGSGLESSSCAPASGSIFPVGTTTVACTATDRAGNSAAASFKVRVIPAPDGQMFGVGFVNRGGALWHFVFAVAQFRDSDHGALAVWVNDHHGPPSRFETTSIDSVVFSDDPRFRPGWGPRPTVDSVLFGGVGRWNGKPGYTFEASASDRGEFGRERDEFSLIVKDSSGKVIASVSGRIAGGNIQSTRLR